MPGWPEIVFILIILVLLFGAKKLPALARGIGQSLGEFKKGREESAREAAKPGPEHEAQEAPDEQPHKPA